MQRRESAIDRARRDLAEGRPWRARDRLGSYLGAFPADQQALDLLGEVRWQMGDLPAAGAAWFLTERDDERAREAVALLRAEHAGSLHGLLGALRVRLTLDDPAWPPSVAARLRELAEEAERQQISWRPGRRGRHDGDPAWEFPADLDLGGSRFGCGGCFGLVGALVSVALASRALRREQRRERRAR